MFLVQNIVGAEYIACWVARRWVDIYGIFASRTRLKQASLQYRLSQQFYTLC